MRMNGKKQHKKHYLKKETGMDDRELNREEMEQVAGPLPDDVQWDEIIKKIKEGNWAALVEGNRLIAGVLKGSGFCFTLSMLQCENIGLDRRRYVCYTTLLSTDL